MRETSEQYKRLLKNSAHIKRHRVFIAGREIPQAGGIEWLHTSADIFSKRIPTVGACVARQINLCVHPEGDIPRMAEIRVETQLVVMDLLTDTVLDESEWIPKGIFFIDTRRTNYETGAVTIHGYDAILKMEQPYLKDGEILDEWPKTMPAVVAEVAERIGVSVDPRTMLQDYLVELPIEYTIREVMGYIAAAHGGNWIITDAGQLRIIPLGGLPPETFNLVTEDGDAITFGGVRIRVG